jgi:molecular chaperone DnaK (HSP70)
MSKIIGIDLGTTNSCRIDHGRWRSQGDQQFGRGTDDTVNRCFSERGERLVGQIAKRQAVTNPENTVFGVKRLIGRQYNSSEVQNDLRNLPYKIEKPKTVMCASIFAANNTARRRFHPIFWPTLKNRLRSLSGGNRD